MIEIDEPAKVAMVLPSPICAKACKATGLSAEDLLAMIDLDVSLGDPDLPRSWPVIPAPGAAELIEGPCRGAVKDFAILAWRASPQAQERRFEQHLHHATLHITIAEHEAAIEDGLNRQAGRSKGGATTASIRKAEALGGIKEAWRNLEQSGTPERDRCGIIAQRTGLTVDAIRRRVKKAGLR